MRKILLIGLLFPIIYSNTGCIKDDTCQDKTVESEAGTIAAYAASNGMLGNVHSTGVYYQVITQGTGPVPTATSQISVRFIGKLLDGTIFEHQMTTPVTFGLSGTLSGFQIGILQIQKGGRVKFILPSSLAYGCEGNTAIPANAILFFDVYLDDVF